MTGLVLRFISYLFILFILFILYLFILFILYISVTSFWREDYLLEGASVTSGPRHGVKYHRCVLSTSVTFKKQLDAML